MTLELILGILFVHWFADFVMQDEDWAVNKSKDFKSLISHTLTYTWVWTLVGVFYGAFSGNVTPSDVIIFSVITFVIHTLTDFITSRVNSYLYAKGKFGSAIPNLGFFTSIGFDQWLHYIQLFLTYQLITKN